MPLANDNEIKRTTARFLDCTLPKSEWTHEAHFAVALCLLADPKREALREMPARIRAYNEATGVANSDTEGYHETITRASILAAKVAIDCAPSGSGLSEILRTMMADVYGRSDWLFAYWTRERLFSVEARRRWVSPDTQPLPFG